MTILGDCVAVAYRQPIVIYGWMPVFAGMTQYFRRTKSLKPKVRRAVVPPWRDPAYSPKPTAPPLQAILRL